MFEGVEVDVLSNQRTIVGFASVLHYIPEANIIFFAPLLLFDNLTQLQRT